MSDVAETRNLLREAFPVSIHGTWDRAYEVAYRALSKWARDHHEKPKTIRRARSLMNGEARRVDGWEKDAARHAALKRARLEHIRARNRVEALQSRLLEQHAHFHGASGDPTE